MSNQSNQIDREEYEAVFGKLAEPVNEYLRRKHTEQPDRPSVVPNFTVLNALASVVALIMSSAPEEEHARIRHWFDDALDEAIDNAVEQLVEERMN